MVHYINSLSTTSSRNEPKPDPKQIYTVSEPPYSGYHPVDQSTYRKSSPDSAIVIDNGSSSVRAGWQFEQSPRLVIPPLMARYTDRKLNRKLTFIGSELYFDGTARGQAKNIYEAGSNIVNNWDVQEGVLDYIFIKLGMGNANGAIDRPVVMTEPLANTAYTRRVMSEILFELYGVPSAAYGIDSLFSYAHNGGRTGIVASSSYMSTHLIPVLDSKPLFAHATRLDWGRAQCAEYLTKLLRTKYPHLMGATNKVNETQIEDLVRQHCYVSQDYDREMTRFLEWTGLEDRDRIVQLPYTEKEVVQKTEEELARAAEKRKESGRRLQEQAAKMRLEKLMRKEQELEYYKDLQQRLASATKKDARVMLEAEDFEDEGQLEKKMREMEKSIRKQRNRDVGDMEEVEEPPSYPLLDVPDDQLDEEGLKQKRQQRLLKSNHDARARAKAEKEREKARIAEEERLDSERRERDPETWIEERRAARLNMIQRIKERDRLKADLGNRKSLAAQMRMKNIANLASDTNSKKRRRGGDDDTFGADDADWGIYRQIATGEQSDDEEEEDLAAALKGIEKQLLEHDPHFTEQSTQEAQQDWTNSLLHAFLHGPWAYDPESAKQSNQFHLNVERIRVPEVVFQPAIAGIDQAGIVEITEDIITQRLSGTQFRDDMLKDIFLTGGYCLFQGFEERLRNELRAVLPAEAPLGVRRAKDPLLDAWRGAAEWASGASSRQSFVSREEWLEKGGEYIKEHNLGNAYS
ncbi:Nuclear actin-protein involved in chromatin remodeling [Taxawa tesnikishii (nom. ined.)]|nr:Nuclear actin-protein involved in chromatin remodeling [Dothideales sp. JES 119]